MHTLKRTVLVTGASSGIGRAIARNLLMQQHLVIGLSRDCSKFKVSQENFHPVQVDLSDLTALPTVINGLIRQFPALDAVIFSAGTGRFGNLEEFSSRQIQSLMDINFTANAVMTRALLPFLKRKQSSDLIYMGSEAALKGSRQGAIYCASKFALRGFSQAVREECRNNGVRVCLINPGMVKTPFFDRLGFEPGDSPSHYLLPEDVAEPCLTSSIRGTGCALTKST